MPLQLPGAYACLPADILSLQWLMRLTATITALSRDLPAAKILTA